MSEMNIRFKKQQYQLDAVASVVECFRGQVKVEGIKYRVDPGKQETSQKGQQAISYEDELHGLKNSDFTISEEHIFKNIQSIQREQNIPISEKLQSNSVANINLDVEMETGTGKTYVYTRTCFELNRQYGWNKFVIVVPSVAIREGVYQSIELTREHFKEEYGKQVKSFIYSSKELTNLESFSTDAGINVMIINVQAFNATGKDARRIYEELDSFGSRRPIDVIKSNRPILIIDEPQKIEGDAKKESKSFVSLKEFHPLFILRYSATHKKIYNKIHRLDALDAYNQKLVKKISVRGISVKGLSGTNAYLYLQNIEISTNKPPVAKLEFDIKQKSGIKRVIRRIEATDNLFDKSDGLDEYKGYVVSEIDAYKNKIFFTNGIELSVGEATGDVSEEAIRRIQIREAIKAHLEKEQRLFSQDIKVLSLFFIDEVAKYRVYGQDGEENGKYAKIFEEEYEEAVKDLGLIYDKDYETYLKGIEAHKTHNGYFSIDKKSKKLVDPDIKTRGEMAGEADDVDAYDLILKDKKRLLSFEEKTRFIFSHSALREGWDNPNVFVICTLKHSDNSISRRQEVGRGMRICVNKHGERMDNPSTVHQTNVLTVIANESYKDFVTGLQKDISETLSTRPKQADVKYFTGKTLTVGESKVKVDEKMAKQIYKYLVKNDYIDDDDKISNEYHDAKKDDALANLPEELMEYKEQVFNLINSVFSESSLDGMVEDESKNKNNPLNNNFKKKEFQELWSRINQKAVYTVKFNSTELVKNCKNAINKELHVKAMEYTVVGGTQQDNIEYEKLKSGESFEIDGHETIKENKSVHSYVKYDLIGKLANETKLTRNTIGLILSEIAKDRFDLYKVNPEEFMQHISRIINEQKATTIIEHLTYDPLNSYHAVEDIFTKNQMNVNFSNALKVQNHVYDYVVTDSNIEKDFVAELDTSKEVVVYSKLPREFFISTPVGDYNPDWAIAFEEGSVKHIYFIAETKGSMSSMQTKKIEEIKIECARKFFKQISTDKVKYDKVDSYESLLDIVNGR